MVRQVQHYCKPYPACNDSGACLCRFPFQNTHSSSCDPPGHSGAPHSGHWMAMYSSQARVSRGRSIAGNGSATQAA